ncbi:sugar transporter [Sphingomonas sp. Leaf16]|nr:sugar transporter [Sphingomonas sp. Leaf16]KQN08696.1 sugar transporter [Sphingomonas sp. Leaf29]KQN17276.1 sugar transporter [Sphingomonas sp. Leaf32]
MQAVREDLPLASRPLRASAKLAYGLGDFGFGLSWNMVGAFLLFFYTDVALLPAAAVGTLLLVSRLADAAIDPVIGVLVDRTRGRSGRARPWFKSGAVPFGLLCAATFWMPPLGENARLIWAIATFAALGILFSVINIPYGALLPMMTNRNGERLTLGSLRAAGTAVSVIVATAATMPLVNMLGGGDQRQGFLLVAALFGLVTTLTTLNLLRCPEQVEALEAPRDRAIWPQVRAMVGNRAWNTVFLFALLNFVRFGAVLAITPFFAINVLGKPWMISILLPAVSGTLLIGSILAPPYFKRMGMRRGNLIALLAALPLFAALPLVEGSTAGFLTLYLLGSVLLSITMTAIFAMAAEAIEYHEQLTGTRNEGLLSSGISLSTKIGMALGGALVAFGLASIGYVPGKGGAEVVTGLRWLYYAPIVACLIAQMVAIARYPTIGRPVG